MMEPAVIITDTDTLREFCARLHQEPAVMVDTEFLRENTYWPQLCLIQAAGADEAACIDPLAPGIDLSPFWDLLADDGVVKVFHAARQDLEIFYHLTGTLPTPIFDTQVAAMVCGFGDSIAYDQLVRQIAKKHLDKSSRFTDWSRRPLSTRQVEYALADVTHLRVVYEWMAKKLHKTGRHEWLTEEMAILRDPATYDLDPQEMWRRLKPRSHEGLFLACVQGLAAWRELEARNRDLPRSRVMKDEALLEIAALRPRDAEALSRVRALGGGFAKGKMGDGVLRVIANVLAMSPQSYPHLPNKGPPPKGLGPTVELLRVLLKQRCEQNEVAAKLVATGDDLDRLALDPTGAQPLLQGWRYEIFGRDAQRLMQGKLGLTLHNGEIEEIEIDED